MLTDPSGLNRENWLKALTAAEDQLEIAAKVLDDIITTNFDGPGDEYDQAYLRRKDLQRRLMEMRLAYHRGENYLIWKLSFV